MNTINQYKNRFYNLLESTMGDVRPLITEDETVSGTPEFNQIVTNLGLDLEKLDDVNYHIKNGNQLFGGNGSHYNLYFNNNKGDITIHKIDSKLPNNTFKNENTSFDIRNVDNTTKPETIKTIVQNVINGKLDKNQFGMSMGGGDLDKFYEFYINNSLEGYDAYITNLEVFLNGGNGIQFNPLFYFKSKNPDNKVKYFYYSTNGIRVSYGGGGRPFEKEYVLDGNKISFEKDRKSTKTTGKYTKAIDPEWNSGNLDINDLARSDKYVKYGMQGDIVRQIQSALLNSGQLTTAFQLAKDNEACKQDYKQCHGTFGKKTLAAVKEFQNANDLVDDGFVGPDTAEALTGL